jgi:hypothetical protein
MYFHCHIFLVNVRQIVNVGKIEGAIKNEQSRDTGNTGHTRHKTKTNKINKTQHIIGN